MPASSCKTTYCKVLNSLNRAYEQNANAFNVYVVCFCVRVDARVVCTSDEIQRNIVRVPVAFVRNELQQFQHPWPHICPHKAVDLYRNYKTTTAVGDCHLFIDNQGCGSAKILPLTLPHSLIDLNSNLAKTFCPLPDVD